MVIRLFNPDHDLALASNQERFTAPHAGRQLRSDLGFLPALWADDGDVVLVDDIDRAEILYKKLKYVEKKNVEFATFMQLSNIISAEIQKGTPLKFDVWGWNRALRFQFVEAGVPEHLLPIASELDDIRRLSGRQMTTSLLAKLREGQENLTCGESRYCTSVEEVEACGMQKYVVKAPWSSSGRGVRYVDFEEEERHLKNTWNWIRNTIDRQGGVMVEPYYPKIKDFAMEFQADGKGNVKYCGLSLFDTVNGAYTGNILISEKEKREMIEKYIAPELIDEVINRICEHIETAPYAGPLGVDMMICSGNNGFLLHPCVEINLRRTMGHVALNLIPETEGVRRTMTIGYSSGNYEFHIKRND